MSSTSAIFRANPGVVVAIGLCLVIPVVLLVMALLMRSAGTSLRPVIFLAVLTLPLVFLFLIGSLTMAREPSRPPETTLSLPMSEGRLVDRIYLFGTDLPDSQIRDARSVFPEFFAEAEVAELGIVGTGESVLAAQFPTAEAAKRAAAFLWETFQIHNTSGDEERGWRGQRRQNGGYVELRRTGRHLFFWTGITKKAAAARRAASHLEVVVSQIESYALIPRLQSLREIFRSNGIKAIGILFVVVLYTVGFFKGAAWAGSTPALTGAPALSATELAARLESINPLNVPFQIERGSQPNEFFATWRYAEAKWADLARAHGVQQTFRIRLILDEARHTLRATDYAASYDWSAGRTGAQIEWQAVFGLVFFQTAQHRVFGLQLDERGNFKPALSYAYGFNVNEMKSPLIAATTRAGWKWRPTIWQGPVWLRWLTE